MDKNQILDFFKPANISVSDEAAEKLSLYYALVIESNKKFNLTAITEETDFIVKHFIDSFAGLPYLPENATVCDIGSGAGFPAIPLAIARGDLQITALDSTSKKTEFIAECAAKLDLINISVVAGRAEEQKDLFGKFDRVTARAVSSLNVLLELAFPLLKTGGVFVAYKTDTSELEGASTALKTLYGTLFDSRQFALPNGDKRAVLAFKKLRDTPSVYPRQYGAIKKKPL